MSAPEPDADGITVDESFIPGQWLATTNRPPFLAGRGDTPEAARADLQRELDRLAQIRANVASRVAGGGVL